MRGVGVKLPRQCQASIVAKAASLTGLLASVWGGSHAFLSHSRWQTAGPHSLTPPRQGRLLQRHSLTSPRQESLTSARQESLAQRRYTAAAQQDGPEVAMALAF
eukprot:224030-Amphidinium_carterae.4